MLSDKEFRILNSYYGDIGEVIPYAPGSCNYRGRIWRMEKEKCKLAPLGFCTLDWEWKHNITTTENQLVEKKYMMHADCQGYKPVKCVK